MRHHGDVVKIAQEAGVSRQTVYLVLRGKSTHAKVVEAIKKLNAERVESVQKSVQRHFQEMEKFGQMLNSIANEVHLR